MKNKIQKTVTVLCNTCLHEPICNKKQILGDLIIKINDMNRLLEYEDFGISVTCAYFWNQNVRLEK